MEDGNWEVDRGLAGEGVILFWDLIFLGFGVWGLLKRGGKAGFREEWESQWGFG
jgi:hypothetical protein